MRRALAQLRPDEGILFRNDPGPVGVGLPLAGFCRVVLGLMGYGV